MKVVYGTVTNINRRQNTVSGNPRWTIEIDNDRTYNTKDDTACNYLIDHELNGQRVELELDGRNQIIVCAAQGAPR